MTSSDEPLVDSLARLISAPAERVYRALLDPEALVAWLPPDGMTGRFDAFDPRPGGSFRMVLTYDHPEGVDAKSTDDADIVEARFVELEPNARVVQAIQFDSEDAAYAGTMTMTWSLDPEGDGTLVTITASDVPRGIKSDDHQAGFASSVSHLAAYLDSQ